MAKPGDRQLQHLFWTHLLCVHADDAQSNVHMHMCDCNMMLKGGCHAHEMLVTLAW